MQSHLDIVNLALANLGNLNSVQSEGEAGGEAEQAALRYADCRDLLLAEHPWGFAARRACLSRLAEEAPPPEGWAEGEGVYLYPADCLKLRRAYLPEAPRQGLPFQVERSADGRRRLIRARAEAGLGVLYTTNALPVSDFPAGFAAALAWRLAADLALGKRADPDLAQAALQMAGLALARERLREATEAGPRERVRSRWEAARRGRS